MKSFIAFLKKEVFECIRSGELTFFCILFLIFGIMNPAIAKLTPWMLETLSDSWSYVKKKYKLNTTNFLFLCNC